MTASQRSGLGAIAAWALAATALGAPFAAAQAISIARAAPREFRAAWVASVANIDWPSGPGLSTAQQRAELLAIFDRAAFLHLNALVLQVRPMCDALYPSELEPWSEWLTGTQGVAPDPLWDPLGFAVQQAHARGLELHAWFNPFRARHDHARSPPAKNHVSVKLERSVVRYGKQLWLDPGDPAATRHSLAVILDVVDRYDIDGVHLDDYFYPYPDGGAPFPDDASYRLYRSEGGGLARGDWRRDNVNQFLARLYREVHARKPWVKVGISPFGIARPGVPRGIEAGVDQYEALAADVRTWLARGWCDYMAPQLYWPIAQKPQSYKTLLDWWAAQNSAHRHLWPGLNTGKCSGRSGWAPREIVDQIALARGVDGADGEIHFSMRALMEGDSTVAKALQQGPYARPALVPASPWLDDRAPLPPRVDARIAGDALALKIASEDSDARFVAIYARGAAPEWVLWRTVGIESVPPSLPIPAGAKAVAFAVLDRAGNLGGPTVVDLH